MSRNRIVIVDIGRVMDAFTSDIAYIDEDASFAVNERKVFDMMISDALRTGYHQLEKEYLKFVDEYAAFGIDKVDVLYIIGTTVKLLEQLFEDVKIRVSSKRCSFVWKPCSRSLLIFEED